MKSMAASTEATTAGAAPPVVHTARATAATEKTPRRHYTAGTRAALAPKARRLVPGGVFDKQTRKNNRLPG